MKKTTSLALCMLLLGTGVPTLSPADENGTGSSSRFKKIMESNGTSYVVAAALLAALYVRCGWGVGSYVPSLRIQLNKTEKPLNEKFEVLRNLLVDFKEVKRGLTHIDEDVRWDALVSLVDRMNNESDEQDADRIALPKDVEDAVRALYEELKPIQQERDDTRLTAERLEILIGVLAFFAFVQGVYANRREVARILNK